MVSNCPICGASSLRGHGSAIRCAQSFVYFWLGESNITNKAKAELMRVFMDKFSELEQKAEEGGY